MAGKQVKAKSWKSVRSNPYSFVTIRKPPVPKFERRIIHIALYRDEDSTAACYFIEAQYDVKNTDYVYQLGIQRKCKDLGELAKEVTRKVLTNVTDVDMVLVNHQAALQVNKRLVGVMKPEVEVNALRTCKNYVEKIVKQN